MALRGVFAAQLLGRESPLHKEATMSTTVTAPTRADKVRHAKQSLDEHIKELAEQMRQGKSENLVRYLEFCSHFHTYSFGNMLLAIFQRHGISRLAGLRQWNRTGRHIRAGEKGIMILAPMTVHKESRAESDVEESVETTHEARETVVFFKPVYVFDVSQTEGAELPSLIHATGEVAVLLPAVREAIRRRGITLDEVETIPQHPTALGVSCGGKIAVRKDLPEADAFRTLVHEFAHELLHWQDKEKPRERGHEARTLRETEADAAAFVVCRHFEVECDTADYLLLYDAEAKTLLDRLETIRQTAARIIEAVEQPLDASSSSQDDLAAAG